MGRKSKIVELEGNVLKILKAKNIGFTTKDIAIKLKISWNTADKVLSTLRNKNKASCTRYGRVNIWNFIQKVEKEKIHKVVKMALEEDIGPGDITTMAVIPADMTSRAELKTNEDCIVCGLDVAEQVFLALDENAKLQKMVSDGDRAKSGQLLVEITGNARALLMGERTALNFLQRLSGIATKTHELAEKIKNYNVKLLDTRKTTPGMRELEKYAVRCGSGHNHRKGLYDEILIKDNHIKLVGLKNAVLNAKKTGKRVEVEAKTLEEVTEALDSSADVIMLDNMNMVEMKKAVRAIGDRAIVEVSGGVDESNIGKIASLGVDWISVGALTHSVKSVDIGLDIEKL